jgi:hypothetical protein
MDTEKIDPHLTATIVGSYVRHHTVGAGQLSDLITTIHRALGDLGKPNQPGSSDPRCVGEAIREPRLRGLHGLRLQGKDATSAHQHPTRLKPG